MNKVKANEIKSGMLVKVAQHSNSDGSKAMVPGHTKKAAPARVLGIEDAGRYLFIDTDMGQLMVGKGSKLTVA